MRSSGSTFNPFRSTFDRYFFNESLIPPYNRPLLSPSYSNCQLANIFCVYILYPYTHNSIDCGYIYLFFKTTPQILSKLQPI